MKRHRSSAGMFSIGLAMAVLAALAMAALGIGYYSARQARLQSDRLNGLEAFYGAELAAWHQLARGGGAGTGAPDGAGRFVASFDNRYDVGLPGTIPVTAFNAGSYVPGTPLQITATLPFDTGKTLFRSHVADGLRFRSPSSDTHCGSMHFRQGTTDFQVCLFDGSCHLADLVNTPADATDRLQGCFDHASPGDVLELPAGKYLVRKPLLADQSNFTIQTAGTTATSTPCGESDAHACAEITPLLAQWTPAQFPDKDGGMLRVRGSGVTVDRVVLNGARTQVLAAGQWTLQNCIVKNLRNLVVMSDHFTLRRSTVKKALCGAGVHVLTWPPLPDALAAPSRTHHQTFINNSIFANGAAEGSDPFWFADGLVLFDTPDSVIAFNRSLDNTDTQLILGGCARCDIHDNYLGHTDDSWKAAATPVPTMSHGAFFWHAWPHVTPWYTEVTTSNDFTGANVYHNWIECLGRCGHGVLIGGNAWYPAYTDADGSTAKLVAVGGRFADNTVRGAFIGLQVDDGKDVTWELSNTITAPPAASFVILKSPFWDPFPATVGAPRPPRPNCVALQAAAAGPVKAIVTTYSKDNNAILLGYWPTFDDTWGGCIPDFVP